MKIYKNANNVRWSKECGLSSPFDRVGEVQQLFSFGMKCFCFFSKQSHTFRGLIQPIDGMKEGVDVVVVEVVQN
jgi:hypothetical protein